MQKLKQEEELDLDEERVRSCDEESRQDAERFFREVDERGPGSGLGALGSSRVVALPHIEFGAGGVRGPVNDEESYECAVADAEDMLREVSGSDQLGVFDSGPGAAKFLEMAEWNRSRIERLSLTVERHTRLLMLLSAVVLGLAVASVYTHLIVLGVF